MVTYNPKDWLKLILKFHKSDSLRRLAPALLLMGIFTALISYIEQTYLKNKLPNSLTLFHQIAGFVISLTLVFRINTAYDRWWEGRKAWGSLLNNCRNLVIKLNAIIDVNEVEKRKNNYCFKYIMSEHHHHGHHHGHHGSGCGGNEGHDQGSHEVRMIIIWFNF